MVTFSGLVLYHDLHEPLAGILKSNIVAPCLSDAPANGWISGFPIGRVTKLRSGLNGVLGPKIVDPATRDPVPALPTTSTNTAVNGVRSNAAGSSMSVCMMRVCGANDDTSLSFVDYNSIYIQTRTQKL